MVLARPESFPERDDWILLGNPKRPWRQDLRLVLLLDSGEERGEVGEVGFGERVSFSERGSGRRRANSIQRREGILFCFGL